MHTSSPQSRLIASNGNRAWAVVTGASSGIGMAIARELAIQGKNLLLAARRGELLTGLQDELTAAHGIEVRTIAIDLATPSGCERLQEGAAGLAVDLLVCSAGFGTAGEFLAGDLEEQLAMVDLNCRSVAQLAWHFGRTFVRRGGGGIVLLSSLVAFQGGPNAANYAATKAYVQSLAEGLHHELAPHGVAVLASAPGPVHTGFAQRARMRLGKALDPATVARGTLSALGRRSTVRPGWLSKALGWSLGALPRWARVRLMHRILGGMVAPMLCACLVLLGTSCSTVHPVGHPENLLPTTEVARDQVRWPAQYDPGIATFFVHNEIEIAAPASVVWEELVQAAEWPSWYEGATGVEIQTEPRDRLTADASFAWTTMGLDFVSVVREFEPPHRLSWESRKTTIKGYHAWLLVPTATGTRVVTDESQRGFFASMQKAFLPDRLRDRHEIWLRSLKSRVETAVEQR